MIKYNILYYVILYAVILEYNKIYTNNIVRGEPCLEARVEVNPIKMPYPPSNSIGSIYENQKEVRGRSFGE